MITEQTNDSIKVGFYNPKTDSMVAVEEWPDSIQKARATSVYMTSLYKSGRHKMPSPFWCVWNQKEFASIFPLDGSQPDEAFLKHVLKLLV